MSTTIRILAIAMQCLVLPVFVLLYESKKRATLAISAILLT